MPIPTQRQGDEPTQPILSAAPDALDELTPDDSALDALLSVPEDCREFTWSGTGTPRIQRYTPDDMRAATALSNQITELRVPAPPRIRAESSESERLALLTAAYKAAHEKVMRSEYWRPRGQKQSDKERQALLQAAEALRVEEINPTAWARFCFHRWHQLGKTGAPSQRWVWNSANVHELAGWCHSSTGSQHTNQPVPLPAVKELIYRLGKLREALGYGRPTDVVVSEVLPDRDRQRLMREQAQQVEQGKRDIEQRIRHGEWVWG